MPAKTKVELLAVTQKEFGKLLHLLDQMPEDLRTEKDAEDTSPKDIVGHRAHWIGLFLGWYADGQAGREVFFPARGYKWNQLKTYNADLRAKQASLGWNDARHLLEDNHARLVTLMESCSDQELYGGPMKGANNDWTPGRWAEASGPSHYRSAAKYLRQRMKDSTK